MIEQEVRQLVDHSLNSSGWILDPKDSNRNVYLEDAVKEFIPQRSKKKLGTKRPDYTLFHQGRPIAVLETKKSGISDLTHALSQAKDYAVCIDAPIVFASNGISFKTQFLQNQLPLILDGVEVRSPILPSLLNKFYQKNTNEVNSIPEQVIRSREDLIRLFSELNDDLRAAGVRAGLERFSEFANILFLKLLCELEKQEIWDQLLQLPDSQILPYMNGVAMNQLRKHYGGDVLVQSQIRDPKVLRRVVNVLNPLKLVSVVF